LDFQHIQFLSKRRFVPGAFWFGSVLTRRHPGAPGGDGLPWFGFNSERRDAGDSQGGSATVRQDDDYTAASRRRRRQQWQMVRPRRSVDWSRDNLPAGFTDRRTRLIQSRVVCTSGGLGDPARNPARAYSSAAIDVAEVLNSMPVDRAASLLHATLDCLYYMQYSPSTVRPSSTRARPSRRFDEHH